MEKALQEHRIDLALVEGNIRQPNLKYTSFLQDELVPVVHTHSKWTEYDEITLEEFKKIPLVLRERGLENCDCLGILSIRSVNKELYAGEMKVLEIKDLSMFREFDFVQLQGQENGLPALFMQFAEHYKEKL